MIDLVAEEISLTLAKIPSPFWLQGWIRGSQRDPARWIPLGKCIFRKFANFWRARSRLYQNEILQENMRLTAFFKLYKICILLHRCNLKIFAKNRFEKTAIFVKFQQKIANVAKFAKNYQISKIPA